MPPLSKKNRWIPVFIVTAGIGLILLGQALNQSTHLGSGVTYGGFFVYQKIVIFAKISKEYFIFLY